MSDIKLTNIMKRLFFLLFVTIMSQSTFYLYADENEKEVETPIPIIEVTEVKHLRTLIPVEACYFNHCIQISTVTDLGVVSVSLLNLYSGEMVWGHFDSSVMNFASLWFDATCGAYELTLITEAGEMYMGHFVIE